MIDKDLWTEDEIEIFELFNYKCADCKKDAVVLHEVDFKSMTSNWRKLGNRIPLCAECHDNAHGKDAMQYKDKFKQIMEKKLNVE